MVALQSSEKAKAIYGKIVEGYSLPCIIKWNAPAYSSGLFLPGYAGAPCPEALENKWYNHRG
jgi:hypothetical protein